jgi:hypothetical protein
MRPVRVYVAGSSHPGERPRCARVMAMLQRDGFELTSRWVERIEEIGAANVGVPGPVANAAAAVNLAAVQRSDVFVLMVPLDPAIVSFGAGVEMGVALSTRKVWTVCVGDVERSVFLRRCSYHIPMGARWQLPDGDTVRGEEEKLLSHLWCMRRTWDAQDRMGGLP